MNAGHLSVFHGKFRKLVPVKIVGYLSRRRQDILNSGEDLPRPMYDDLFDILGNSWTSALVIAFEDSETVPALEARYPGKHIDSIVKSAIMGKSVAAIIRKVRRRRYDVVVISNRDAQVFRSLEALQMLAYCSRARKRIVLPTDGEILVLSTSKFFTEFSPRIIRTFLTAVLLIIRTTRTLQSLPSPSSDQGGTKIRRVAFLRPDLSGPLRMGGSVSHILGFVTALDALGVRVLYCSDSKFDFGPLKHVDQEVVPPDHTLSIFDEVMHLEYNFRFVQTLIHTLKDWKPDCIYQRHSIFSMAGVLLSRELKVPLYLEVNGSEVWARQQWGRLLLRRTARKLEAASFRNATKIFAVSEAVKTIVTEIAGRELPVIVNPNGVDPGRFRPTIRGSRVRSQYHLRQAIVVGFVGTFLRGHGVETLVEAASMLAKRRPAIRFLLIGSGPLKNTLEMKSREAGLTASIRFAGAVPYDQIPQHLAACDILISPHNQFSDGTPLFFSPIKLFEYMAMGKPIIASNLEQLGEVIRDGENGLLMEPGNASDLADKILRLARDPQFRMRLGRRARRDVKGRFAWESNARRVLGRLNSEDPA